MKLFNNYWIRSGLLTLTQRLSVRIIGVVSFIVLVRLINEHQMGVWALFLGISTMLEMLRNGLLKSAFVKYYTESENSLKPVILSSSFAINIVYSVVVSAILLLCADLIGSWFNAPELVPMMKILALASIFLIPFSHFEFLQQGEMKFEGVMWSYLSKQGLLFLLILASTFNLFGEITTKHLSIYYLLGVILGSIVSYFFARKYLKFNFVFSISWIARVWIFGKYGFLSNIGTSMLNTADQYLIGGLINTSSVGMYSVASRTTNIFTMPSVAIADILYPKSVEALSNNGKSKVKDLYENAVGAIVAAMIPAMIFVLLFPEFIIRIVAGSSYLEAAGVLKVLILTIVIRPFIAQFGTIVNTLGKPVYNFIFVCSLSVIGIILNFLLIREIGILGAVYANLITLGLGLIVSQIILHREVNITLIGVLLCVKKYSIEMPKMMMKKFR